MGEPLAAKFTPYGPMHLVIVVILVAGAVGLAWYGRSRRGTAGVERLRIGLAVAIPVFTLPLQAYLLTPGQWAIGRSLPLQLCDWAWMVATYALWTKRRWAAIVTYFWGLTLTSQAIITPDLGSSFPDPAFFMYWGMHMLVVWAAVFLTWGLGLLPDWRGYGITLAATLTWAVCVYAFNVAAGTNYGFLNRKPGSASILDLLGDWPWYVFAEVVLVAAGWALLTWPWVALQRARNAQRQ